MTRTEENNHVIDVMTKLTEENPTGTFEQMTVFQLGVIATMLGDISKSLAIIADGYCEKVGESGNESEDSL